MTQSKHTPGPWEVQGSTYITVNSLILAHCKQMGHVALEEAEANSRLIAAAPDLLEALKVAIDIRKNPEGVSFEAVKAFIERAEAVIAKAEGDI